MGRAIAIAGLMLAFAASPALAQQSDAPPKDSAVAEPGTAAPAQPKRRNQLLIDVIKAVVPPLIDAAKAKPAPPPAEQPAAAEPAAVDPATPAPAETAIADPAPPPAEPPVMPAALPKPAAIAPSQPSAPPPERPARAMPPPIAAAPAPPLAGAIQTALPERDPVAEKAPPVATPPVAASPMVEAAEPVAADAGRRWLWLLAAAVVAAAAAGVGLDRARRVARTRKLLSLAPRLDSSEERGASAGLSLAGPVTAVRARLKPEPALG